MTRRTHRNLIGIAAPLAWLAVAGAAPLAAQDTPQRIALGGADTVAVSDRGSGPAVVLVPGLLGGAHGFRRIVPGLLEAGHRVIVIEPLGTGASSRPAGGDYSLEAQATRIESVLGLLHVDSALFVCHSVGGSMCYRLALRAPALVQGIVALNGGPDEEAATSGLRFALRFAPVIRVLGSGRARSRLRDGLIDGSADPKWVTDEIVAAYTMPFADLGRALDALKGMASAREPQPLAPRLSAIRAPVRLLVGTAGEKGTTSPQDIDRLTGAIPDITVERVAGAGQYIQEEQPSAVLEAVAALRAWLEGRR